jgi:hypothetical protein
MASTRSNPSPSAEIGYAPTTAPWHADHPVPGGVAAGATEISTPGATSYSLSKVRSGLRYSSKNREAADRCASCTGAGMWVGAVAVARPTTADRRHTLGYPYSNVGQGSFNPSVRCFSRRVGEPQESWLIRINHNP